MDHLSRPKRPDSRTRKRRLLALVAMLAGALCAFPAFAVGYIYGQLSNDVSRGNRDVEQVKQIIATDSEKFGSLTINRGPADKLHLEGVIRSEDDLVQLRDEMVRAFGESRAEYILEVRIERASDG